MGCDIHLYAEVKKDGQWVPAVEFTPSEWWYEMISESKDDERDLDWEEVEAKYKKIPLDEAVKQYGDDPNFLWECSFDGEFGHRNYMFFGILADVRAYDTICIDQPRGLPEDCSKQVRNHSDRWGIDGHSHSHLSLKELQEFDWEQTCSLNDTTSVRSYAIRVLKFSGIDVSIKSKLRNMYSLDDIPKIPQHDLEKMCYGIYGLYDPTFDYISDVEWLETYRDLVGSEYLDALFTELASFDDDPNNVRIVFWFDN